jgi:hypothetical protein
MKLSILLCLKNLGSSYCIKRLESTMVNILPSEAQHKICEYSGFLIIVRYTSKISCVLWMNAAALLVLKSCIDFFLWSSINYKMFAYCS